WTISQYIPNTPKFASSNFRTVQFTLRLTPRPDDVHRGNPAHMGWGRPFGLPSAFQPTLPTMSLVYMLPMTQQDRDRLVVLRKAKKADRSRASCQPCNCREKSAALENL